MMRRSVRHGLHLSVALSFVACATACASRPPRPTSFDSSAQSALLLFGPPAEARSDQTTTPCLETIRDADARTLTFPRDAVVEANALQVNPGRYELVLEICRSRCSKTEHEPLVFDARAGARYRIVTDDWINILEAQSLRVLILDDASGATVAEAQAFTCYMAARSSD